MNPSSLVLIAEWAGGRLLTRRPNTTVTRVCTDSRTLQAGDFFVALRGENFDGHLFVADAARIGAVGALVDKASIDLPPDFGVIEVQDTLRGLQQLSGGYRRTLNTRIVAITGSNGKTSTKDLTAGVLGQQFRTAKTEGNLNNHIGVPLTLLRLTNADQAAVVEIGMNHRGEIAPLAALANPEVAIITNIGVAHIEYMGSREAIAEEKGTLAEAITESGTVILNADDDMTPGIAKRSRGRVLTAGLRSGDIRATDVRALISGMAFQLEYKGEKLPATLPVPGAHMVQNAVLACGAGVAFGLSLEECVRGLKALDLSKGRLQQKEIGGFTVLDDSYNANPDSVLAGLATLAALPGVGRRIAVLGRMGELGHEAEKGHRRVGVAAGEQKLNCLIAVGSEAQWIAEEARSSGVGQVIHVADTDAAAAALRTVVEPGDVVLVKGSRSARMERVIQALETEGKS